jgi:hypothetical protein
MAAANSGSVGRGNDFVQVNRQIELEINKEYPVGTPLDWGLHGVHGLRGSKFTVITDGRTIFKDCRYEGYGSLFSTPSGEILTNARFFHIQP